MSWQSLYHALHILYWDAKKAEPSEYRTGYLDAVEQGIELCEEHSDEELDEE